MSDKSGNVYASVPGLAHIANVSLPDCETALTTLLSPDKYSRTPSNEGRRIEPIDGGWALLNHAKFRAVRSAEERREYMREYMREKRAKAELLADSLAPLAKSTNVTPPAPAPAPAPAIEKEPKQKADARASRLPADWEPSFELCQWSRKERPDVDPKAELPRFRDYWVAKPGKDGRKTDWPATWRNWIRNVRASARAGPQQPPGKQEQAVVNLQGLKNEPLNERPDRGSNNPPCIPRIGGPAVR